MRQSNYINYGMCIYTNVLSKDDAFQLGDIVINKRNEIGVIIQVHSPHEFRSDMFGNCCTSEIKLATKEQVNAYRPNINNQAHFTHQN